MVVDNDDWETGLGAGLDDLLDLLNFVLELSLLLIVEFDFLDSDVLVLDLDLLLLSGDLVELLLDSDLG